MNILFTSVGRRVELIRAFRDAYRSLGLIGRIVGLDIEPLAPALRLCDKRYIVPRLSDPVYLKQFLEICEREDVGVIFPLIDPDITNLARHRQAIEGRGFRLAIVPADAAAICADKWLTRDLFSRLGLQTPASWLPGDPDLEGQRFPLFLKPRKGSASHHTFRLNTRAELKFFSTYVSEPIIQEFLPGPEITSDVACDLEGNVLAVVSRRRIEVRGGEVLKGVTIHDDAMIEACVEVARELRAVGPITVQCMMREGVPYFTEINARLGGGVPLGIAAGADYPKWLLARCAGEPVEIPPLGTYQTGLYISRFDESIFLTEVDRAAVASDNL